MPDDLYDRDILIWSERQADLLRRLAAGERVNADIDWTNLVEEVEAVGRSELHSCESLLQQALLHLLKLAAWPASDAVSHWEMETLGFLDAARRSFTPSMRQRIDIADLYGKALRQFRRMPEARALPTLCPYTVDDLLADDPDIDALIARLRE